MIAALWGIAWLPPGLALGIRSSLVFSSDVPKPAGLALRIAAAWMLWGAASGALFATLVALAEGRRSIQKLSRLRIALWGAGGCVAVGTAFLIYRMAKLRDPHFFTDNLLFVFLVCAVLGAMCAMATLFLMRSAADARQFA